MKKILLFTIIILSCTIVQAQNNIQAKNNWDSKSLEKESLQSQLKVYPNPVKGEYLNIDFSTHKISEILISNIAGKIILKKKINFPESKLRLKTNDIPNGIYLAKIKTVSNKTVVKKLIVSKP